MTQNKEHSPPVTATSLDHLLKLIAQGLPLYVIIPKTANNEENYNPTYVHQVLVSNDSSIELIIGPFGLINGQSFNRPIKITEKFF